MGALPRGPEHRRVWRPDLAYAVGLLATDGHLSVDGRHIILVSADRTQLDTLRRVLRLPNAIRVHPPGRLGLSASRVQFSDRLFHQWLQGIGFVARKTYNLGALAVPDAVFPDFLRGHLDGDGSITAYVDRYHAAKNPSYVYQRLYVRFLSASREHIAWLRTKITDLLGRDGYCSVQAPRSARHVPLHILHFAKHDAIALLRWIYYAPDLPCLARKRAIAEPFLTGDARRFRHPAGAAPDDQGRSAAGMASGAARATSPAKIPR